MMSKCKWGVCGGARRCVPDRILSVVLGGASKPHAEESHDSFFPVVFFAVMSNVDVDVDVDDVSRRRVKRERIHRHPWSGPRTAPERLDLTSPFTPIGLTHIDNAHSSR